MAEMLYEFSVRVKCKDLTHVKPGVASSCILCQHEYNLSRKKLKKALTKKGVTDNGEVLEVACSTCGQKESGLRYLCHGMKKGKVVHLLICFDCVLYFSEGEVPEVWP